MIQIITAERSVLKKTFVKNMPKFYTHIIPIHLHTRTRMDTAMYAHTHALTHARTHITYVCMFRHVYMWRICNTDKNNWLFRNHKITLTFLINLDILSPCSKGTTQLFPGLQSITFVLFAWPAARRKAFLKASGFFLQSLPKASIKTCTPSYMSAVWA